MKAILNRWRNEDMQNIKPPLTATVDRPLSKQAQAAIEAHYIEIVQLKTERDNALAENERAKELCVQAKHEINALHTDIADLKAKALAHQLERDSSVAKFAALEGLLISILAQLRAHKIPETQAQTVAPDAEAPVLEFGKAYKSGESFSMPSDLIISR